MLARVLAGPRYQPLSARGDDIVIQAILCQSDVPVTCESYIQRDGVDPRSLAAMEALQALVYNQSTTAAAQARSGVVVQ